MNIYIYILFLSPSPYYPVPTLTICQMRHPSLPSSYPCIRSSLLYGPTKRTPLPQYLITRPGKSSLQQQHPPPPSNLTSHLSLYVCSFFAVGGAGVSQGNAHVLPPTCHGFLQNGHDMKKIPPPSPP